MKRETKERWRLNLYYFLISPALGWIDLQSWLWGFEHRFDAGRDYDPPLEVKDEL